MQPFTYQALPTRVVFGAGAFARLPEEAAAVATRLLVLATPEQAGLAEDAGGRLGDLCAGVFAGAVMHVPVATVDAAEAALRRAGADGLLAIGGGSTTGLAKAIALRTGVPIVAVPTTYAGSEMTPIWGLTEDGVKRTGRDRGVLPRTAIYDPLLTLSLPPRLSAVSGLNAVAHCVEGLYAENANPLVSIMAEESIRAIGRSLTRVIHTPDDLPARSDMLYGAWLGGVVLGSVGMALHHKLCHTLGGTFNLPHAETHAIVLPHAAAYNAAAAPEAMMRVARALSSKDGPGGLYDLLAGSGAPRGLKDIGMPEDGLDRVVELALTNPYYNPAPLAEGPLRALLGNAFEGRAPVVAPPAEAVA
ncbi:maleylacetate reductase [Sphingomonas profundi]|uniref:maleylacetate reductase n=1 Tax=Alterirhizorhabdus profundi TaxID=2681549 RepID=UPI0012E7252A|nr:maleylacetate reductase [Sphingomonas profundi]